MKGPIAKVDLNDLAERDSDEDVLEENEFPYMSGRLKEINWQAIVAAGKQWRDPTFPHGRYALFIDHKKPMRDMESKKAWMENVHWKRASEYFDKDKYYVFQGVDPNDIIMGGCNNCYMLAAMSSIAEAHYDETIDTQKGLRIKDNFLTQEVNAAGCYAV